MTESSAEQKVREVWEEVTIASHLLEGICYFMVRAGGRPIPLHGYETESAAWQAAWEYTEARLKLVAEIEEEIAWLSDGIAVSGDDEPIGKRILAAEQARLAEARRGLKGK